MGFTRRSKWGKILSGRRKKKRIKQEKIRKSWILTVAN